jgi:hypothetical protein
MPVLSRPKAAAALIPPASGAPFPFDPAAARPGRAGPGVRTGWFETCSNPACASGWLHLWRSRTAPVFEGGWSCSPACTRARVQLAVGRELDGRGAATESHRHRIPLGLVMLEQGWISSAQLRQALEAQKTAGGGRLGQWLMLQQGVEEHLVLLVPRLFVDAFGALPLRVAAGRLLYLGFEDRLDPVLALALERMHGLRVESGLVNASHFHPAHARLLEAGFPSVQLIEAATEAAVVEALSRAIERARPVEARLVRVHDCLWMRMWSRPQAGPLPEPALVRDAICSMGAH